MSNTQNVAEKPGGDAQSAVVRVQVVTTSGVYPKSGFSEVPATQKISVELEKAKKELGLVGTDDWIVQVGGNTVSPQQTYAEAGLHGEVKLDWGPRHGAGGRIDRA